MDPWELQSWITENLQHLLCEPDPGVFNVKGIFNISKLYAEAKQLPVDSQTGYEHEYNQRGGVYIFLKWNYQLICWPETEQDPKKEINPES